MKTPLAWHNLLHNRVRSGVALAGVTFATVLMFMQLGFLEAVKISATLMYDGLAFDLCLRSRDYNHFSDARWFPESRLNQAQSVAGVTSAAPLLVSVFSWRNPQTGDDRAILAVGVPSAPAVFQDPPTRIAIENAVARPQSLLIDTKTRREFGPQNGQEFGPADHGVPVEVNGKRLAIAGHFTRGAGLSAGGAVILPRRDFHACLPELPEDSISLGLLELDAQANPAAVAAQLENLLPNDVEVQTREQVLQNEVRHWVWQTNYGLIFQSGVVVAVIVGAAIVYQVLASDVSSRLPEYATLKAIGYSNRYIVGVMVQQSLLLALIAYVIGAVISQGLYVVTAAGAQIPIRMTGANLLIVLGLVVALCVFSGVVAVRKAFRADPADLF